MEPQTISVDEAVIRFQREEISLAKAAELTAMTRIDFQRELARRRLPVHYDSDDLEQETPIDLASLQPHR
jgi:predicted HTH domain antitoxin